MHKMMSMLHFLKKNMELDIVVDKHKTLHFIIGNMFLKSNMAAKFQDGHHNSPFYMKWL